MNSFPPTILKQNGLKPGALIENTGINPVGFFVFYPTKLWLVDIRKI